MRPVDPAFPSSYFSVTLSLKQEQYLIQTATQNMKCSILLHNNGYEQVRTWNEALGMRARE